MRQNFGKRVSKHFYPPNLAFFKFVWRRLRAKEMALDVAGSLKSRVFDFNASYRDVPVSFGALTHSILNFSQLSFLFHFHSIGRFWALCPFQLRWSPLKDILHCLICWYTCFLFLFDTADDLLTSSPCISSSSLISSSSPSFPDPLKIKGYTVA